MESPRKASHKAVADPGEGPWGPALPFPPNSRLFLDQTETPKGKTKFLKPGSPLYQGLDHHPPLPPPTLWIRYCKVLLFALTKSRKHFGLQFPDLDFLGNDHKRSHNYKQVLGDVQSFRSLR